MISSRFVILSVLVAGVLAASDASLRSQGRQDGRTSVIVVYNAAAFLDGYASEYRPGNRDAADAPAWGYQSASRLLGRGSATARWAPRPKYCLADCRAPTSSSLIQIRSLSTRLLPQFQAL
jgi:hypothetical protein